MTKPTFQRIPGRYYLRPAAGGHCAGTAGHFVCPYPHCRLVFCSACWKPGDTIGEQKCPHCGGAFYISTSPDLEA